MSNDKLKERIQLLVHALAACGVVTVEIPYDGEGDSGQIEDIFATGAEGQSVPLDGPAIPGFSEDGQLEPRTLREVVDDFAWDLLAAYHDGFENNEGGYGTITIDVVEGRAIIDHNDRIIEVVNSVTEV